MAGLICISPQRRALYAAEAASAVALPCRASQQACATPWSSGVVSDAKSIVQGPVQDGIHSRSIDCRYVPLDKELLVETSARICGPRIAQRSKRRADGQRAMVIRRIDELTAKKVSIVISARAAFGEDFGYRTAWSIGLPAGLITSVFARPFHDTREFGLAFSAAGDRRRMPR